MSPSIALGSEVYNADSPPVRARGYRYSHAELNAARAGRIQGVQGDQVGQDALAAIYNGLEGLTGFGEQQIREALEPIPTEDHARGWREGEALAEAWLADHKECEFPWPFNRDLRHPRASLPGPEFVGFAGHSDADVRFAFGQVKTSKENENPPTVVRKGDDGLVQQMKTLRDNRLMKQTCVHFLTYRHRGTNWASKFRVAAVKFFNSSQAEVAIFGVLIRDVQPANADLANAAQVLSDNCPALTRIELAALYLPLDAIPQRPNNKTRSAKRSQS